MRALRLLLLAIAAPVALMAAPLSGASAATQPPLQAAAAGSYPFGKDRAVLKGRAWKLQGVARTGTRARSSCASTAASAPR